MPGPFRVVMADEDTKLCETVAGYLTTVPDIDLVEVVHDGVSVLKAIDSYDPDLLLIDICIPGMSGLEVLRALRYRHKRPKVVVFSAQAKETLVAQAVGLGVSYYMMKPFDLPILAQRLRHVAAPQVVSRQLRAEQRRRQIEKEVDNNITALGVPAHFKGCRYLKEAVILVVEDSTLLNRVTKGLYPAIAREFGATPFKVERAIRHAIEVTWTRGNLQAIHRIFAYSVDLNKGKPTNSSFVARLADQVRMQLRAG